MGWFNRALLRILHHCPRFLVNIVAGRYISGDSLEAAIACTQKVNAAGAMATIDYLGEFICEHDKVVAQYRQVLAKIAAHNLTSVVSLKLTSFGALIDAQFCRDSVEPLVAEVSFIKELQKPSP